MDEDALLQKLRVVEARFAPPGQPPGNESCRAQLAEWRTREADVEHHCSVSGPAEFVFVGLCARYGLEPYRRSRRSRTPCVRAPSGFFHAVLWPQFEAMSDAVEADVGRATKRVLERWSGVSFDALVDDVLR